MAPPARLAHIVFRTNQLDVMVDWYLRVLEARIVFRSDSMAFITYDDEHHRVAILGGDFPEHARGPSVGFYHAAFAYDSLQQLLDTSERLAGLNIHPWRLINHGPTISYYYADPDGNDVELQVDCFRSPDEATAYMNSDAFRQNPVGVILDEGELRARHARGEIAI